MRSMQWQLGISGTISAFACRHRETKKNLCRDGRSAGPSNLQNYKPSKIQVLTSSQQSILSKSAVHLSLSLE